VRGASSNGCPSYEAEIVKSLMRFF
jgi:hypothetical protein